jgi:hypothetical protein
MAGESPAEGGTAMAIEWRVKGTELVNCNCAYGCPRQFNALPTHGDCRAAVGYQIEEGHFGAAVVLNRVGKQLSEGT